MGSTTRMHPCVSRSTLSAVADAPKFVPWTSGWTYAPHCYYISVTVKHIFAYLNNHLLLNKKCILNITNSEDFLTGQYVWVDIKWSIFAQKLRKRSIESEKKTFNWIVSFLGIFFNKKINWYLNWN